MQEKYERTEIEITAFITEDVLLTSGLNPEDPLNVDGGDPPVVFP